MGGIGLWYCACMCVCICACVRVCVCVCVCVCACACVDASRSALIRVCMYLNNILNLSHPHLWMENFVFCHVSTTSLMPLSMLNSLLADVTISEMVSAKLCSSIANKFSSVNVSGFMSKFFLVDSISFCQCL